MKRTPMELAALATSAVPGLTPTAVFSVPDDARDFDAAIVTDDQGNRWRVRSPRHERAGFRLETEIQVLTGFSPAIRAKLPFRVPSVAGAVQLDDIRTFVYHQMPGAHQTLEELTPKTGQVTEDIGRMIAGIHGLPASVVEAADLPVYSSADSQTRLLNELDQAALTGKVPSVLLNRWEAALEEKPLWQFTPCVVHGDFHEDNILIERDRAVGVTGWTELHSGDPAQDLSWLASVDSPEFRTSVLDSYQRHREQAGVKPDEFLMQRAALLAEFALAQWLLANMANNEDLLVHEATKLLVDLAEDVEETGGQDIGLPVPKSGISEPKNAENPEEKNAEIPEPKSPENPEEKNAEIPEPNSAEISVAETSDSRDSEPEFLVPEGTATAAKDDESSHGDTDGGPVDLNESPPVEEPADTTVSAVIVDDSEPSKATVTDDSDTQDADGSANETADPDELADESADETADPVEPADAPETEATKPTPFRVGPAILAENDDDEDHLDSEPATAPISLAEIRESQRKNN